MYVLSDATKQTFSNIGGEFVPLDEDQSNVDNRLVYTDIEKILSQQLVGKKEVALVRPDRFVVFTCNKANLNEKLHSYFKTLFQDSDENYLHAEVVQS